MNQNEHPSAPTTLDSLPNELLILISEHLPHPLDGTVIASRKDRATLARLCRVSKRWREVVQPILWRHVVVDSTGAVVALVTAKESLRRLMTVLTMSTPRDSSADLMRDLKELGQALPSVEGLRLTNPFFERPIRLSDLSIFGALRSLHLHDVHIDLDNVPTFPNVTELALVRVSANASIGRLFESSVFPSLRHMFIGLSFLSLEPPVRHHFLPSASQAAFPAIPPCLLSQLETLQIDYSALSEDATILTQPSTPILVMLSLTICSLAPMPPGIPHVELYDFPDFRRVERGALVPFLSSFESYLGALAAYIATAAASRHPVLSLSASDRFLAPDTFHRAHTALDPVRAACTQHGVALRFVPDGRMVRGRRTWESHDKVPLVREDFARWWARVQVERAMHMMETVRLGA
ncbi:hypothetical protein JCM10450v2_003384 [Rhodotorula kratochvilovae]